jgi:hypothetical protein
MTTETHFIATPPSRDEAPWRRSLNGALDALNGEGIRRTSRRSRSSSARVRGQSLCSMSGIIDVDGRSALIVAAQPQETPSTGMKKLQRFDGWVARGAVTSTGGRRTPDDGTRRCGRGRRRATAQPTLQSRLIAAPALNHANFATCFVHVRLHAACTYRSVGERGQSRTGDSAGQGAITGKTGGRVAGGGELTRNRPWSASPVAERRGCTHTHDASAFH